MKCPHCNSPLTTGQSACTSCGFSASAIRAYLGADWVRLERVTDVAGRLNLRETRHLETVLDEFERRFPQCFMAGYIGVLPETLTLTDLGFWLINHGAFQTHQISRRNDFAIVLLIDPLRQQGRQEQRHSDVADLDPLDEKAEHENQGHHEPDVTVDTAGQQVKHAGDEVFSVQAAKGQRKDLRHHQDVQQYNQ